MTQKNFVHWLQSSVVTFIVIVLFALFVIDNSNFNLSNEYQLVPEGFVLPRGSDIKIDIQSGETWAKKNENFDSINAIVAVKAEEEDIPTVPKSKKERPYPAYKNITKNRIQSRLSGESFDRLEAALNSLELEDSWAFLEEEAPAMEFGLAVFESKSFPFLRAQMNNDRALSLIATCLQNNPLAIEKIIELKVHSQEIVEILKNEQLEASTFLKVLRILESLNLVNEENIKELVKKHAHNHELNERYTEFINNLQ